MVLHTMAWPRLNSPSVPRSDTKISAGIWLGTTSEASAFGMVAKPEVCISTARAHAAHPGAGDDADRLLFACARERGEESVGVQRLDQRREYFVGDVDDQPDVVAFQRCQYDVVPGCRSCLRVGHGARGRLGHVVNSIGIV